MAFHYSISVLGYISIVLSSLTLSVPPIGPLSHPFRNVSIAEEMISPQHVRQKQNVIDLKITRSTIHCLTECSLVEKCLAVKIVNVNGSFSCLLLAQKSYHRKREGLVFEINKYRNPEMTDNGMLQKHFKYSSENSTSKAKTLPPQSKSIKTLHSAAGLGHPRSYPDGRNHQNGRVCKNVPSIGKRDGSEILLFAFKPKGLRMQLFALDNVRFVRLSCTLPRSLKFLVVSSKDCVVLYSGWALKYQGIQSMSLDGTKRKVISVWSAAAAVFDKLRRVVVYSASPVRGAKPLQIRRVNLNGSDERKVRSITSPCEALAIDPNEKRVYYRKNALVISSINYIDQNPRLRHYYGALTHSSLFLTFVTVHNKRSLAWLRVGISERDIVIYHLRGVSKKIYTIQECPQGNLTQMCGSHEMIYALCNDWLYAYRNGSEDGKGVGIPEEAKGGASIWMVIG